MVYGSISWRYRVRCAGLGVPVTDTLRHVDDRLETRFIDFDRVRGISDYSCPTTQSACLESFKIRFTSAAGGKVRLLIVRLNGPVLRNPMKSSTDSSGIVGHSGPLPRIFAPVAIHQRRRARKEPKSAMFSLANGGTFSIAIKARRTDKARGKPGTWKMSRWCLARIPRAFPLSRRETKVENSVHLWHANHASKVQRG